MSRGVLLVMTRPSWFNYFFHILLVITIPVAIWKRAATTLRVFEKRVVLKRGVLSANVKEISILDIRTIDTRQSFIKRLLGIGDILIATAGTSGYEYELKGMAKPTKVKEKILQQKEYLEEIKG